MTTNYNLPPGTIASDLEPTEYCCQCLAERVDVYINGEAYCDDCADEWAAKQIVKYRDN